MSTPASLTLQLRGKKTDGGKLPLPTGTYDVVARYDLSADRAETVAHEQTIGEDQIVALETADGLEWFGLADDLPRIFDRPLASLRGGETTFVLPQRFGRHGATGSRGVGEWVRNTALSILQPRAAEPVARALGERIDQARCSRPGLHMVGSDGKLLDAPAAGFPADRPALLFLHGTISNFTGAFGGIREEFWQQLHAHYGGQLYAFNHYTLTTSPVANVVSLLREHPLPEGARLDIISHSRGGLVADVLARCAARPGGGGAAPYADHEIALMRDDEQLNERDPGIAEDMETLNDLMRGRRFHVGRSLRVACPAYGTTLLAGRLDHFAGALLTLFTKIGGPAVQPLLAQLKAFILAVIEERTDPATFPGLYAMVPDSAYVKINNAADLRLDSELVSIAGDFDVGGGILQSLKVILSNLYYWRENDLVVNTASMTRGVFYRRRNVHYTIESGRIDHFSYFDEPEYMRIAVAVFTSGALPKGIQLEQNVFAQGNVSTTPGVVHFGELGRREAGGRRPIVVLLPGIMGSNLYVGGERKWLDVAALGGGALVQALSVKSEGVTAETILRKYYGALVEHLETRGYDVLPYPYDWRRSLAESAEAFGTFMRPLMEHGQPISLVAHSMGGLLARQWMFDHRDDWVRCRDEHRAKLIMLGTPWRGSHLITEVLTGHSKRVRQLSLLDQRHTIARVTQSVGNYPGLWNLLPLDDGRLTKRATWERMYRATGRRRGDAPVAAGMLKSIHSFRGAVEDGLTALEEADWQALYYVAGKDRTTVDDFEFHYGFFGRRERLRYLTTSLGDGSVSWAGIPEQLRAERTYYTEVQHGRLADDETLLYGITDLIERGHTRARAFRRTPPVGGGRRGGTEITIEDRRPITAVDDLPPDPLDALFGIEPPTRPAREAGITLRTAVFNGDLRWSRYPLMIGHFGHDGIVSAERALDQYLGGILSERHAMGFYPSTIDEQDVIIDYERKPPGAVIIGLGDKDELTGYRLSRTVEKGVLKYAVFARDNQIETSAAGTGISSMMIGSNYGQLPLRETVRSILLGIQRANQTIATLNERKATQKLRPVTTVEFVDFYEDQAYECYKILYEIDRDDSSLHIELTGDIERGFGARRRFLRDESRSWWQSFTTRTEAGRLHYTTYNRSSSVSQDEVHTKLELARFMAQGLSTQQEWNRDAAKALFELLIPNRYKDFLRNHRNIAWRMDVESAAFPWEMFHDPVYDDTPTFVRAGMVRQLISRAAEVRPALVRSRAALVVANPKFTELAPLPAAEREGHEIAETLEQRGYQLTRHIGSEPLDIMEALYSGSYKIIHIASHGEYAPNEDEPEKARIGIAIGGGQLLEPGTLAQLSAIPELMFVNCCFVGQIDPRREAFRGYRHELAANVGTQLIRQGVKAIVVAGWAVDDAAARVFANTFYDRMLKGEYFGEAVRQARAACYDYDRSLNTWGAYQCYGDQFYRLTDATDLPGQTDGGGVLEQELVLEFDNLISRCSCLQLTEGSLSRQTEALQRQAHTLLDRAERRGITSPALLEREAEFYAYLGQYATAIDRLQSLLRTGMGDYKARNLETYCYLRAKQLMRHHANGNMADTTDAIDLVVQDLTRLPMHAGNSSLLSTTGSTYKRAFLLKPRGEESTEHLRTAAKNYLQAARLIGTEKLGSVYHLTSYLTLATLYKKASGKAMKLEAELGRPPQEYLNDWIAKLDVLVQDRSSIYAQMADTQLHLCRMVMTAAGRKKNDHRTAVRRDARQVIELQRQQLGESINIRDFYGEIEHMDFLIEACERLEFDKNGLITELRRIRDFLASYLE